MEGRCSDKVLPPRDEFLENALLAWLELGVDGECRAAEIGSRSDEGDEAADDSRHKLPRST
jgi:hypothetical protein